MNTSVALVLFLLAGPSPEKPTAINPEAVESVVPADCPYKAASKDCSYISYRARSGGSTVNGTFEEVVAKLTGKPIGQASGADEALPPSIFQGQGKLP